MSTTIPQIPPFQATTMKLSHSNDSIVTAVEEDVTIPQYFGAGFPKNTINTPDLSEIGTYLDKVFRHNYTKLLNKGGRKMCIVGILGSNDAGCLAYAKSLEKACDTLGVELEVFDIIGESFEEAKAFIAEMNGGNDVDGMIVFTPIFGGELDEKLRACIAPHLDIEALSPTSTKSYQNAAPVNFQRVFNPDRFPKPIKQVQMDDEPTKELVEFTSGLDNLKGDNILFPCTPMGVCQIIMSIGSFWNHHVNKEDALKGKVITIYNRSAVFGRPLAQMLANTGAIVYSRDVEDILLFSRPYDKVITTQVEWSANDLKIPNEMGELEPDVDSELLYSSDLIISAVPKLGYKIKNTKLRAGCGLINVATGNNFCQEMIDQSGWYVPRVGLVTRRCLLINALIARVAREQGVAIGGQGTRHDER